MATEMDWNMKEDLTGYHNHVVVGHFDDGYSLLLAGGKVIYWEKRGQDSAFSNFHPLLKLDALAYEIAGITSRTLLKINARSINIPSHWMPETEGACLLRSLFQAMTGGVIYAIVDIPTVGLCGISTGGHYEHPAGSKRGIDHAMHTYCPAAYSFVSAMTIKQAAELGLTPFWLQVAGITPEERNSATPASLYRMAHVELGYFLKHTISVTTKNP